MVILGNKIGGTAHEIACYSNHVQLVQEQRELTGMNSVMVHSAISMGEKANGTTTRIKEMLESAMRGEKGKVRDQLQAIMETHDTVLDGVIKNEKAKDLIRRRVYKRISSLREFAAVAGHLGRKNMDPKLYDCALGMGERLSTPIATGNLEQHGIPAEEVTFLGMDKVFDPTGPKLSGKMSAAFGAPVEKVLKAGKVPVVSGYGQDMYRFFGRGYSDAMAILVMNYLIAKSQGTGVLSIIKNEVPGVLSADPKIVQRELTRLVGHLSVEELGRLQAEVVHPMLIPCIQRGLSLHVRNISDLNQEGTLVDFEGENDPNKRAKAINILGLGDEPISLVEVKTPNMIAATGVMAKIATILADMNIDMIGTTPDSVRLTVKGSSERMKQIHQRLSQIGTVTIQPNMAQVIMVGNELERASMSELCGITEDVLNKGRASNDMRVHVPDLIESARNYVSFCVPKEVAPDLARALHKAFLE